MNTQTAGVRPKIKDFFKENTTVYEVNNVYQSQPELFNYIQALDNYVDHLESITIQQALELWDACEEFTRDWDYHLERGTKVTSTDKRTYFINKFDFDIDKMK